ncbi:unnamed protein product [Brachionus calyciflorus]|uniref:OTU domain-containing protein n=1 Tax=Brachionus calyciflorus TaxID=104777 RepID=A0A813W9J9_9BILA|nr:unnamed protein product [Brachionus calyciflorus]
MTNLFQSTVTLFDFILLLVIFKLGLIILNHFKHSIKQTASQYFKYYKHNISQANIKTTTDDKRLLQNQIYFLLLRLKALAFQKKVQGKTRNENFPKTSKDQKFQGQTSYDTFPKTIIDQKYQETRNENFPKTSKEKVDTDSIKQLYNTICSFTEISKTSEDKKFSYILKYIQYKREAFIKLVKHLRCIKSTVLYLNQELEENKNFSMILSYEYKEINLENHKIIKCNSDGNCFYNAISTCLYGTEINFVAIKLGVIFIMIDYRDLFEEISNNHIESFEKIVIDSSTKNYWANELNILAASILINRPIISFNSNSFLKNNVNIFKVNVQKFLLNDSRIEPIMIAHNNNHFCPILSKERQLKYQKSLCYTKDAEEFFKIPKKYNLKLY